MWSKTKLCLCTPILRHCVCQHNLTEPSDIQINAECGQKRNCACVPHILRHCAPPPFWRKIPKYSQFFWIKSKWIGWKPPLLTKIFQNPHSFMITPFWNRWVPPPFWKKKSKKISVFLLIKSLWIGWEPPFRRKYPKIPIFYDNTLLEKVRPPPRWKKIQKILVFFWSGNFGLGKTLSPPFRIFPKKSFFYASSYR